MMLWNLRKTCAMTAFLKKKKKKTTIVSLVTAQRKWAE